MDKTFCSHCTDKLVPSRFVYYKPKGFLGFLRSERFCSKKCRDKYEFYHTDYIETLKKNLRSHVLIKS